MAVMTLVTSTVFLLPALCLTIAEGKGTVKHHHYTAVSEDKTFEDDLTFQTIVNTENECAMTCSRHHNCTTFTFLQGTCRGHSRVVTVIGEFTPAPKAKTFSLPIPESVWLEQPCVTNDNCTASNATCYQGLCLCVPGFYFSGIRDSCVSDCPFADLQPTFLKYVESFISGNNIACSNWGGAEGCKTQCLEHQQCRSLHVTDSSGQCCMEAVTPLDVPQDYRQNAHADFYQRTCF